MTTTIERKLLSSFVAATVGFMLLGGADQAFGGCTKGFVERHKEAFLPKSNQRSRAPAVEDLASFLSRRSDDCAIGCRGGSLASHATERYLDKDGHAWHGAPSQQPRGETCESTARLVYMARPGVSASVNVCVCVCASPRGKGNELKTENAIKSQERKLVEKFSIFSSGLC